MKYIVIMAFMGWHTNGYLKTEYNSLEDCRQRGVFGVADFAKTDEFYKANPSDIEWWCIKKPGERGFNTMRHAEELDEK